VLDRSGEAPPELTAFVGASYSRLVRVLTLYSGSREVALDVAQDALVRLCRDWERVKKHDNPQAWLLQVGFNLARSGARRRAAERRALARMPTPTSTSATDTLSEVVDVRRALAALPPRRRQVIILRYYLGYTVGETADLVGCSPNAVSSMTTRALGRLRETLRETPETRDAT
jgi:RNA polymerase sigma-70 factor (sigma-E family)